MLNLDILIPCKPLRLGKSRLALLLSARQRYELCISLLDRTLKVATRVARPDRVFLITADREAAARAAKVGVSLIADPAGELNSALEHGRGHIVQRNGSCHSKLLVLPIDLPFVDEATIVRMPCDGEVTIAGDRDDYGTNLVILRGHALRKFQFRFGPNSFAHHCEGARRAGLALYIINDPAIAFDIDEPAHYLEARCKTPINVTEPA